MSPIGAGVRVRLDETVWAIPRRAGAGRVSLRFERAREAPPLGARVRLAVHAEAAREGAANPGGHDALRAGLREAVAVRAEPVDPGLLEILSRNRGNHWFL